MAVNRVFHFYFFSFYFNWFICSFLSFSNFNFIYVFFFFNFVIFYFFPVVVNGRVVCGVGAVRRPAPVTPSNEPPDNWIYM